MASAKQKAAQARFREAAKAAKREGLKGKAYTNRVGQLLRNGGARRLAGGGGGGRKSRPSASRASPARRAAASGFHRAKSAASSIRHAGRGLLDSVTPAKAYAGFEVLNGLSQSIRNSKGTYANGWDKAVNTIMPLVDGVTAGKAVMKAAHTPAMAPGLIGELANMRVFGGKFPKVTLRKAVNAAPSAVGLGQAFRTRRALLGGPGGQFHGDYNLMPRTGSLLGLRLRNANKVGGAWVETLDLSLPRDALLQGVLQSPATPAVVGGAASRYLAKARVF